MEIQKEWQALTWRFWFPRQEALIQLALTTHLLLLGWSTVTTFISSSGDRGGESSNSPTSMLTKKPPSGLHSGEKKSQSRLPDPEWKHWSQQSQAPLKAYFSDYTSQCASAVLSTSPEHWMSIATRASNGSCSYMMTFTNRRLALLVRRWDLICHFAFSHLSVI